MLRGLAAIGWNANGHADWLFLLVKWSGICQTGGDQCGSNCSLVVTHAFTLEGFIWENSDFILRCVKFVHQNPRESITTDSQSISGCLKWMYHSGFLSFSFWRIGWLRKWGFRIHFDAGLISVCTSRDCRGLPLSGICWNEVVLAWREKAKKKSKAPCEAF